jgi:hypothetical protein
MRKIVVIILLALIPTAPQMLGFFHFLVNGGLQWPMEWNNEAVAWGVLLIPAGLVSIYLAFKYRYKWLVVLPLVSVVFVTIPLFTQGYGPSSKSDSEKLELVQFWTKQWGYW